MKLNEQTLSIIWLITLVAVVLTAVSLSMKTSYELEANCEIDDMKARSSDPGYYIEGEASCEIDVSGEVPVFLLYLQNKEVIAWLSNYQ